MEEEEGLELELYFDNYETSPRSIYIPVKSVEEAKSVIKSYERDSDFQHATLYKIKRYYIPLN